MPPIASRSPSSCKTPQPAVHADLCHLISHAEMADLLPRVKNLGFHGLPRLGLWVSDYQAEVWLYLLARQGGGVAARGGRAGKPGPAAALGSHERSGDAGSSDRAQRRGAEAFGGSSTVFPERN